MKKFLSMVMAFCLVMTLLGGVFATAETTDSEKVFRVALKLDFEGMRLQTPWFNNDISTVLMYRRIVKPNADFTSVSADLADSYTISPDGLTYTFTIHDGYTWHDGEPVTPNDVVWTLNTMLRASRVKSAFLLPLKNIEGAEEYQSGAADSISGITVDGNVITLQLKNITSSFLQIMGQIAVLPEHLLKDEDPVDIHNSAFFNSPIGCGMYKIDKFEKGNYVTLVPHTDYDPAPNFDKVIIRFTDDEMTLAENGELDWISTNNPQNVKTLQNCGCYDTYSGLEYWNRYFIFNIKDADGNVVNPDLAKKEVREALLYAIDREALVSAYWPGQAEVIDTGLSKNDPNYLKDAKDYAYNPELAKSMLEEAGYDFSKVLKIRYYYSDQLTIDFMTAIAYYLNAVGISTDVQKIQGDATAFLYEVKDYDLAYKALAVYDQADWYSEYVTGNKQFTNIIGKDGYFDSDYDSLLCAPSDDVRAELLQKLQLLEQEHLYKMPLFKLYAVNAVNKSIQLPDGMTFRSMQNFYWDLRFEEWDVK